MAELNLTVISSIEAASGIKLITLRSGDNSFLPGFTAGAHIKVTIPDGSQRHYSLIQLDPTYDFANGVNEYQLGIRLEEDSKGGSKFMHSLAIGDSVICQTPENEFPLAPSATPPLLIAGGIGVTPITAMICALHGQDFIFHYTGRNAGSLALVSELKTLAGEKMTLHADDDETALDLAKLFSGFAHERPVYVCGPKGLIEAVKTSALNAKVPAQNIHFELFTSATEAEGDSAFEVELSSSGVVYTIPAGQTIIEVLEAAGEDPMYDCQRGDCGICQVDVLDGIPDHRDVVLSDDEKAANNVMQICVSRAKSKRLVLDL